MIFMSYENRINIIIINCISSGAMDMLVVLIPTLQKLAVIKISVN